MNKIIWILFVNVISFYALSQKRGGNPNNVHIPEKGVQSEVESNYTKATGYFLAEKFEKALSSFEDLLKKDKNNAAIYFMISRSHFELKDIKNAIKNGEKAISYPDSEREFFIYYSNLLKENKYKKEALITLERLFKTDKPIPSDYILLGKSYRSLAIDSKKDLKILKASESSSKLIKQKENDYKYFLEKEYSVYTSFANKHTVTQEINKKSINTLFLLNRKEDAWNESLNFVNKNPEDLSLVYNHCSTFFKIAPEKTITFLEHTIKKNPNSIENKLLLHDFYNQVNQPQKASKIILKVFQDPSFNLEKKIKTTHSYLLTQTALHQETGKKMINIIKKQHPKSSAIHSLEGDYYISHLVLDSARLSYLKALNQHPTNAETWEKVIRISLQQENHKELINDLQIAKKHNPESPILSYYKGFGHYRLAEYDSTIQNLESAKNHSPTPDLEIQIQHLLAESYYKNKQHQKAWETYEEILLTTPNDANTLNNFSYFLALENEKLPEALSMAKTLMRIAPNKANYIDTYAWVLFKNNKFKEALNAIEPIATKSNSSEVIDHYGDILLKNNKKKKALEQWKKALKIDPSNDSISQKIKNHETE